MKPLICHGTRGHSPVPLNHADAAPHTGTGLSQLLEGLQFEPPLDDSPCEGVSIAPLNQDHPVLAVLALEVSLTQNIPPSDLIERQ